MEVGLACNATPLYVTVIEEMRDNDNIACMFGMDITMQMKWLVYLYNTSDAWFSSTPIEAV